MPSKDFILTGGTPIRIFKRRGSTAIRITIARGQVRITIPVWATYTAGRLFAQSKEDWIAQQLRPVTVLLHGQAIGKAHHLSLIPSIKAIKPVARLSAGKVTVRYPVQWGADNPVVQDTAREAVVRALRHEAETLLPQRLRALAEKYNFTYSQVTIKRLTGRWGSCDHEQNIVLNLFLMQVPWDLIDYVILHELTHTVILRHGPDFWAAMDTVLPDAKQYRHRMKAFQPEV
jgi:predicted metal-dependent hydrolase